MPFIDHAVYPDEADVPAAFATPEAKADYVHRVCTAWDFHILPERETFQLFATWQDIFDAFPVGTSPAYHAFRAWFAWPPLPFPPGLPAPVPLYRTLDEAERRGADPCETWI